MTSWISLSCNLIFPIAFVSKAIAAADNAPFLIRYHARRRCHGSLYCFTLFYFYKL